MARRAKIGLEGITRKLVDAVRAKRAGVLEVQFAGTDSKGGATWAMRIDAFLSIPCPCRAAGRGYDRPASRSM